MASDIARPRIFISSVVQGFEAYCDAARIGIENAGGEAVLVNEQFPSLAISISSLQPIWNLI
jgi:hypothetical protein